MKSSEETIVKVQLRNSGLNQCGCIQWFGWGYMMQEVVLTGFDKLFAIEWEWMRRIKKWFQDCHLLRWGTEGGHGAEDDTVHVPVLPLLCSISPDVCSDLPQVFFSDIFISWAFSKFPVLQVGLIWYLSHIKLWSNLRLKGKRQQWNKVVWRCRNSHCNSIYKEHSKLDQRGRVERN